MKTTAKDRQTVLDLAIVNGGHIETAMALAAANNISVTERLADGQVLIVPEPLAGGEPRTVELYRVQHVEPATEASEDDMTACPYGGIGFMGIEIDFEVS
ncbi:MAG: hypothetical protein HDS69_09835 [Bacteroidales bacterium]|nr:hypothetical protein [Bacteroidales bacterium]